MKKVLCSLSAACSLIVPVYAEVVLSNGPQLFLDDYLVAGMTNLTRRINQPVKHPANPVIVRDLPWEKRMISTYGTVFHDPRMDKFRFWYTANEHHNGIPDNPEHPTTVEYFVCYAESDDGVNWYKPMVSRETFGLHDQHNIVIPGGHGFCVLSTPNDPDPTRRYKGAGGASFGFSLDGLRWELHNWRDAVGKNDTSSCIVQWNGEYLAYVRYQVRDEDRWPGAVMRATGLCVSKDFETWTPKELIFTTDDKDGYPWTQPYGLSVTPYGDQLIGIMLMLHLDKVEGNNSVGDEDTQLVVSRDGRHWERVADRATLLAPTSGSWDRGRIHAPTTRMFVKDDLVYIYYSASDARHGQGWGNSGIGLATLPADRFVAVRQSNAGVEGVLQTPPMRFSGKNLLVNADVCENDLQVALLDKAGRVLPGFGRDQSHLIRRDNLRYRIIWATEGVQKSLEDIDRPQSLAIRFILRNGGSLYGFQITP